QREQLIAKLNSRIFDEQREKLHLTHDKHQVERTGQQQAAEMEALRAELAAAKAGHTAETTVTERDPLEALHDEASIVPLWELYKPDRTASAERTWSQAEPGTALEILRQRTNLADLLRRYQELADTPPEASSELRR